MTAGARVLHLASIHRPFDTRIFQRQCRSLAAAGYDVTFMVPGDRDEVVDGVQLRCPVPWVAGRRQRLTRVTPQIARAALAFGADLAHIHELELVPLGFVLARRGVRVVYDVHEDYPRQIMDHTWDPVWVRRAQAAVVGRMEAAAGRRFDHIVTATEPIAAKFPAERTTVVFNFPDLGELTPPRPRPYAERRPAVAFVGNISPVRGSQQMAAAAERWPERLGAELVLAGRMRDPELGARLEAGAFGQRVVMRGWLDRAGVRDLLGEVRAGLVVLQPLPRIQEAQPIKLYEYMAAGLPVVASDFPAWRAVIEGAGCGLCVDPDDPQAIADAVTWLLEHPAEAEAMGRRGRQAVEAHYNWEREAAKLVGVYDRVLGARRRTR